MMDLACGIDIRIRSLPAEWAFKVGELRYARRPPVDTRAMVVTTTRCGTVCELLPCGIESFMTDGTVALDGFASWLKDVAKEWRYADEFFVDCEELVSLTDVEADRLANHSCSMSTLINHKR